jgi:ferrous iron transport protein B
MPLYKLMSLLSFPEFLKELLVFGVYRTLTWIISVMLPPMAIFFPLFTLLEDVGYLPRVAFNLDGAFCRCGACGKQGLTMCMGLGCNAVGVTGARIIDGKRERLIAILTNSLIPCNGRFPAMITVASVFFIRVGTGDAFLSALLLAGAVGFGVGATFLLAFLLSKTLLKGTPGTFVLELPPYRKPQIIKTVLRSVLDRTVVVLGRAVAVAAPAGAAHERGPAKADGGGEGRRAPGNPGGAGCRAGGGIARYRDLQHTAGPGGAYYGIVRKREVGGVPPGRLFYGGHR